MPLLADSASVCCLLAFAATNANRRICSDNRIRSFTNFIISFADFLSGAQYSRLSYLFLFYFALKIIILIAAIKTVAIRLFKESLCVE